MIKKLFLGILVSLITVTASTPVLASALTTPASAVITAPSLSGWQLLPDGWYYYANGERQTGWIQYNGKSYYLDTNGLMLTGWQLLGDIWYYFYPDGAMATGESYINGRAYTLSADGVYLYDGIRRAGLEDDLITGAFENIHKYDLEIRDMINRINTYRQSHNKPLLQYDTDLALIATYRCLHMQKYGYYSHYYNNEPHIGIIAQTYFGKLGKIRENLNRAVNSSKPAYSSLIEGNANFFQSFVSSSGHNSILLQDIITRVGVGYYVSDDMKKIYISQIFATDW